jgi:hypothetical protein
MDKMDPIEEGLERIYIRKGKKYYYVRKDNADKLWIGNEDGEGGEFSESKVFDVFDQFFKKEF